MAPVNPHRTPPACNPSGRRARGTNRSATASAGREQWPRQQLLPEGAPAISEVIEALLVERRTIDAPTNDVVPVVKVKGGGAAIGSIYDGSGSLSCACVVEFRWEWRVNDGIWLPTFSYHILHRPTLDRFQTSCFSRPTRGPGCRDRHQDRNQPRLRRFSRCRLRHGSSLHPGGEERACQTSAARFGGPVSVFASSKSLQDL